MSSAEIQKLIDEAAIRNLVGKLAIMADHDEDLEEYFDLWTEDGIFDMREPIGAEPGDPSQVWTINGLEELKANRKHLRDIGFQGPASNVWHANTTLHITVLDDTSAEAQSYWVLMGSKEKVEVLRIGHYHDTFRKTEDGWKIAYRRVTPGRAGSAVVMPDDS